MSCCGTYSIMQFKTFASYGTIKIEVLVPRMGYEKGIYVVGKDITYNAAYALVKNKNAKTLILENYHHESISNKSKSVTISLSNGTSDSETSSIEASNIPSSGTGTSGSVEIEGNRISTLPGEPKPETREDKKTRSKRGRKTNSIPDSEKNENKKESSDSSTRTSKRNSIEQTIKGSGIERTIKEV